MKETYSFAFMQRVKTYHSGGSAEVSETLKNILGVQCAFDSGTTETYKINTVKINYSRFIYIHFM